MSCHTIILDTRKNIHEDLFLFWRVFFLLSLYFNMSIIFLFEDGHGNVVDENGGPDPMEYIVDQDEFVVEAIATHSEYVKNTASSEPSPASPMLIEKPKDEDS